jgi:hypothetical protein
MATGYDFTSDTRNPAYGTKANGIYVAVLPWSLRLAHYTTTSIWIGTNSWVGLPNATVSLPTSNFGPGNPLGGRILLGAANNILYKITWKILGTEPNRYAYLKYEAMLSELGAGTYETNPIVWEMTFPENRSGHKVVNAVVTYPEADYIVRIISNARYGTNVPGVSAVYAPIIPSPTNADGLKLDLTNYMAPGSSFKITKLAGILQGNCTITNTFPSTLDSTSTLLINGGVDTNFVGPLAPGQVAQTGTVVIYRPGASTQSVADPIANAKDLMFHSNLPYVQIIQKVTNIGNLSFPAVARGLGTFPDPGGGGKGKIICTKLYELGLLSEEIYLADQAFGDELVKTNPDIYNGYRAWAEIVVDWMEGQGPKMMPWMTDEQFSKAAKKWSTTWAHDIATPWAEEMAYKMGKKDSGSLTGKLITAAGIPICKVVGVWQRVFGPSKKPAGFGKGLMLIPVFIMFKLVTELGRLIESKK